MKENVFGEVCTVAETCRFAAKIMVSRLRSQRLLPCTLKTVYVKKKGATPQNTLYYTLRYRYEYNLNRYMTIYFTKSLKKRKKSNNKNSDYYVTEVSFVFCL